MSTEVAVAMTPQQQFEKNIKDRLTKDIGELIPDSVLAQMVTRATEEIFFKDRKTIVKDGYYDKTIIQPAAFVATVKELMEERAKAAVNEWFAANSEKIEAMVKERFDAGLATAVLRALDSYFSRTCNDIAVSAISALRPKQ